MSSHEERTKNFEKISTDLRNMMSELKAHYPDHIIKVVWAIILPVVTVRD